MSEAFYVERGGEQVFQPPDLAQDVRMFVFVLKADLQQLQANICDRYLNQPAGGNVHFRAAGPLVLLVFSRIASLSSLVDPDKGKGHFDEDEAALWVLVEDRDRERLMWFHPYMLVSNSYEMATGREVFGFHKIIGSLEIPDRPEDAARFTAAAVALKQFSPQTAGTLQTLMTVRRAQQAEANPLQAIWTTLEEAAGELGGLLETEHSLLRAADLVFHEAEDLFHLYGPHVPMVFLKQFRDAARPQIACYQSIVEVTTETRALHGAGILSGDYELLIEDCDSHPIRRELGLPLGPIRPLLGYWVNFDFALNNGVEIWRASEGAAPWHRPEKKRGWLSWAEGCPLLRRLSS